MIEGSDQDRVIRVQQSGKSGLSNPDRIPFNVRADFIYPGFLCAARERSILLPFLLAVMHIKSSHTLVAGANAGPVVNSRGSQGTYARPMAHVGPERYVICLRAPFQRAFFGSTNGAATLRRQLHKISQRRLSLETLLGARAVADQAEALQTTSQGLTGTWRCLSGLTCVHRCFGCFLHDVFVSPRLRMHLIAIPSHR